MVNLLCNIYYEQVDDNKFIEEKRLLVYIKVRVKYGSEKVFRYLFCSMFLLGAMFMCVGAFDLDDVVLVLFI